MTDEALKLYVQNIKELPTIPVTAQEILGLVSDDLVSVSKLEKIIENDPAIAAKIISVANSAYFGVKTPSKTLNNAILRIGFNNVRNIALAISLITIMSNGKSGKPLDYLRVFNHSVSVGFIAGLISREIRLDISDEIMVNGMLHDIGYLVLNRYFPQDYEKVLIDQEKGEPLLDAEEKELGFTHAHIGKWLAQKWNLPGAVVDTTLYHHTPSLARKNLKRVAIIHIADYIVTRSIWAPTVVNPDYPFDRFSRDMIGLSEKDLKDLEEKISGGALSDGFFK